MVRSKGSESCNVLVVASSAPPPRPSRGTCGRTRVRNRIPARGLAAPTLPASPATSSGTCAKCTKYMGEKPGSWATYRIVDQDRDMLSRMANILWGQNTCLYRIRVFTETNTGRSGGPRPAPADRPRRRRRAPCCGAERRAMHGIRPRAPSSCPVRAAEAATSASIVAVRVLRLHIAPAPPVPIYAAHDLRCSIATTEQPRQEGGRPRPLRSRPSTSNQHHRIAHDHPQWPPWATRTAARRPSTRPPS